MRPGAAGAVARQTASAVPEALIATRGWSLGQSFGRAVLRRRPRRHHCGRRPAPGQPDRFPDGYGSPFGATARPRLEAVMLPARTSARRPGVLPGALSPPGRAGRRLLHPRPRWRCRRRRRRLGRARDLRVESSWSLQLADPARRRATWARTPWSSQATAASPDGVERGRQLHRRFALTRERFPGCSSCRRPAGKTRGRCISDGSCRWGRRSIPRSRPNSTAARPRGVAGAVHRHPREVGAGEPVGAFRQLLRRGPTDPPWRIEYSR